MHITNILLVDDQLSSLLSLEEILDNLEANLIKASSGKKALLLMLEHDIDCILLDVSMPGMDGFEFLKTLQSGPAHAKIPVIMVTGKIFSENETLRAYKYGAVDFLLKPLDSEVVYRKVSFFVEQAQKIKSLGRLEEQLNALRVDIIKPLEELQLHMNKNTASLPEPSLHSTGLNQALKHLSLLSQEWRTFRSEKSLGV